MNLYIQIENGKAVNHPAFMDNLIAAFGNIPENWKQFIRVPKPIPDVYQILENDEPIYEFNQNTGYWMDTWNLRDMTAEEKAEKQQAAKDAWLQRPNLENFSAWTFDESTCRYNPPVEPPDDGKIYKWNGSTNSWVEFIQTLENE